MNISNDFNQYGGSYLLSNDAYEDYVQGRDVIGRPDGQFMIPTNQMDELTKSYPNNPREWEKQLGLNEGSLGNERIRRVDVYNPQDYNPRLPTSDLSGANNKFLEGKGKVPGGQDECVIDQFPNPEKNQSVGKISRVDVVQDNNAVHSSNKIPSNHATDKIADGGGARAPDQKNGTLPEQKSSQPEHQESLNTCGRKPDASESLKNARKTDNTICGTTPGNPAAEKFDPKIETNIKGTEQAAKTAEEASKAAQEATKATEKAITSGIPM